MATKNDSQQKPPAEPGKPQAGVDGGGTRRPADDDEEPWRHPPVTPRDEDPLKSLGRSVSDVVTGPLADVPAKPKA